MASAHFLFSGRRSLREDRVWIPSSLGSRTPSITPGILVCITAFFLGQLPEFGFGPPIQAIPDPPGEAPRSGPVLPPASPGWGGGLPSPLETLQGTHESEYS